MPSVTPWNGYWDSLPDGLLFFPAEGEEAVTRLAAAVPLAPDTIALDYGCGYGHAASPLAKRVGKLFVWDQSERMMSFALTHLADRANVAAWDPNDDTPRFDLIWVNSVVQYMSQGGLAEAVRTFARLLKPTGVVVLSDLIPPAHPFHKDALSLFAFSLRRGYFVRAFTRTRALAKKYDAQKKESPLFQPTREQLTALATASGFDLRVLKRNLTHFRHRTTAILTRAGA